VARRAAAHDIPVVALGGSIARDVADGDFPAFAGMFSICSGPMPLERAMRDAGPLLEAAAERVVRLFARAEESGRGEARSR
jgi:glycerate kinase